MAIKSNMNPLHSKIEWLDANHILIEWGKRYEPSAGRERDIVGKGMIIKVAGNPKDPWPYPFQMPEVLCRLSVLSM